MRGYVRSAIIAAVGSVMMESMAIMFNSMNYLALRNFAGIAGLVFAIIAMVLVLIDSGVV